MLKFLYVQESGNSKQQLGLKMFLICIEYSTSLWHQISTEYSNTKYALEHQAWLLRKTSL